MILFDNEWDCLIYFLDNISECVRYKILYGIESVDEYIDSTIFYSINETKVIKILVIERNERQYFLISVHSDYSTMNQKRIFYYTSAKDHELCELLIKTLSELICEKHFKLFSRTNQIKIEI